MPSKIDPYANIDAQTRQQLRGVNPYDSDDIPTKIALWAFQAWATPWFQLVYMVFFIAWNRGRGKWGPSTDDMNLYLSEFAPAVEQLLGMANKAIAETDRETIRHAETREHAAAHFRRIEEHTQRALDAIADLRREVRQLAERRGA